MRDIEQIVRDGAEVNIFYFQYTYSTSKIWSVAIKQKTDGVELNVNATGERLDHAVDSACGKWDRVAGGIKEFSGPLITHESPIIPRRKYDD